MARDTRRARMSSAARALSFALLAAACSSLPPEEPAALHARLRELVAASERGECASALRPARELSESSALDLEARHVALAVVLRCTSDSDHAALRRVVARAEQLRAPWAWPAKFHLALLEREPAPILAAFHEVAEHSPSAVRELEARLVGWLFSLARDQADADEAVFAVHESLARARYRARSSSADGELALEHVRLLLLRGQIERARARLPKRVSPDLVLQLRTRALFAALRGDPALEAKLDYRAAAEEEAEAAVAEWEAKPSQPAPLHSAVRALRALARPQEAIALAERGLNLLELDPPEDADETRRWLLNEIAYAHYDLGDAEPARTTLERAAAISEHGQANVSQRINLASQLVFDSRPQEALAAIEPLPAASGYGEMWALAVRVCANEQLGRSAERDARLAEMRAQEDDNPAALEQALLCANLADEAAALFVRRLANADHRELAFEALHPTQASPAEERPFAALIRARARALAQRPEVRAAAAALGTIETIPLRGTYWGSF